MKKKEEETLVGVEIKGYKLIEKISKNERSLIYKAISPDNRIYCMKLIIRNKNKEDPNEAQLFNTESNALTILNHNSIVKVYNYFVVDHFFVLVSEYMKDGSLDIILQQRHFFSNEEAQQLIFSLTLGLQYCHSRNIVHHDIKPSNILFNNNRAAFADFDLHLFNHSQPLKISNSSIPYTAPEILKKINTVDDWLDDDRASDIWSLGVILYLVLSGRLPWSAANRDDLIAQIKRGIFSFAARIPPMARDLISKMMDMEPVRRITFHEIIAHPWLSKVKTNSFRSSTGKRICLSTSLIDFHSKYH